MAANNIMLIACGVSCHFLLAQKVTKKGTTNANRLIGLVAQGYTPGPTNLTFRTVRGQAARRQIKTSYKS